MTDNFRTDSRLADGNPVLVDNSFDSFAKDSTVKQSADKLVRSTERVAQSVDSLRKETEKIGDAVRKSVHNTGKDWDGITAGSGHAGTGVGSMHTDFFPIDKISRTVGDWSEL